MFGLEAYFSWSDIWSPLMLFATVLIIVLYFGLIGPFRSRFEESTPVSLSRKLAFVIGVLLVYIAQGGPINVMSHLMFTFHMAMMSLCYIVAPPLIMMGIPDWLWKHMLDRPLWARFRWATHPILTALLFNVLFSIYHVPVVHDYIMLNFTVHIIYYIALFITAVMMWWPVIVPVKEWNHVSDVKKMGYIFLNGVLITPACALIIFADIPLYATYYDSNVWAAAMGYCVSGSPEALLAAFEGPQFFNWFTVLEDQQLGGILMKLIQEITYGFVLFMVFMSWFRREGKDDDRTREEAVAQSTLANGWKISNR